MAEPDSVEAPSSEVARPGEDMTPAEAYRLLAPRYGADGQPLPDHFETVAAKAAKAKAAKAAKTRAEKAAAEQTGRAPDADGYDGSGDQEAENPGSS